MENVAQISMSTKVEDYLFTIPSPQTQKNYRTAHNILSLPLSSILKCARAFSLFSFKFQICLKIGVGSLISMYLENFRSYGSLRVSGFDRC